MLSANELDAVTIDAFGTLVELSDPVKRLREALFARGVERDRQAIASAFVAEVEYYLPRSVEGRDEESLARLRRGSAGVFLRELGVDLDPDEFAPAFVGALEFRALPGARSALHALRAAGLSLACAANWDIALAEHLERLRLVESFSAVVTSAEVGAAKPDPAVFTAALERLEVEPARALHIGDGEVDREGALAAGLAFAPVPLATLPRRLGL